MEAGKFEAGPMFTPASSSKKRSWDDVPDSGVVVQSIDFSKATKRYEKCTHIESFPGNKPKSMFFVKFYWLEDYKHKTKTGNPGILLNEPKHYNGQKPEFMKALQNLASVST